MRIKSWMIKHCADVIGEDRMFFGSDYPIMHPNVGLEAVERADINVKNVLYDTINDLLF